MRIAVIGGGVAGVTACHILQRDHEVTLFEKNSYVGGHTHTVVIDQGPDAGTAVDMGFIVLNDKTYPTFHRLLSQLEIPVRPSEMSFSYACEETGLVYAGTSLGGLFAQRRNLFRPAFLGMLADIARFSVEALRGLERDELEGLSLRDFLGERSFSERFIQDYLLPMASAIWSSPTKEVLDFPAQTFVHFFRNHGLLNLQDRPNWQTVAGGSHAYIQSFLRNFSGKVVISSDITTVKRGPESVRVRMRDEEDLEFDRVVLATHADEALALLEKPTPWEQDLLGSWTYQNNHTVLHTDQRYLPPLPKARASWNYRRTAGGKDTSPVSVTYWMNRLQGLNTREEYCVTLNPTAPIEPARIVFEVDFAHPLYNFQSVETQAALPGLNGKNHTFYCGSYFGYGFHEDAVKAGAQVAACFGLRL